MLIFAIDDEPRLLRALHRAIAQAEPGAEIMDFSLGTEAVRALEAGGPCPDIVFSDIRMPQLDGLALAVKLKTLAPRAKVVFVTGYEEYSLEAYRVHASGYITKPVEVARVREEIDNIAPARFELPEGLWVRCFGAFEVFWNGKPVCFARRQSKELFAYLIDREGGVCTAEEISAALWEDEDDLSAAKARLRVLLNDLKSTLAQIGREDVLVRRRGMLSVAPDRIPCDYYCMRRGDMAWVNRFYGEYMSQYSWAEVTRGRLCFERS